MISIVIPTLNEGKYLEDTLANLTECVASGECEVIVSDGKSVDNTISIAKKYGCKVVEYLDPGRQTIGQGRNMGAAVARGEYLVFIDADVTIPNPASFFKNAIHIFTSDEALAAITVGMFIQKDSETFGDYWMSRIINLVHYLYNNVFKTGSASGEFMMLKTQAFKAVGGFSEKLTVTEDNELYWRLAKKFATRFIKNLYILHSGRRVHKVGWPRLLTQWILNAILVKIRARSYSKEWTPIR